MPLQPQHPDLSTQIDERRGVLPMAVLRDEGVTRGRRRAMVAGGRWRVVPGKGVITTPGMTSGEAAWREALLEVGPGASLGGVTALESLGMTGFVESLFHIWVPKGHEKKVVDGVRIHETRRWTSKDATTTGLPRSKPAVATVQACLWAVSVRQAMLCLVMPIQQRLVLPDDVAVELSRIRRHRYRKPLEAGLRDIRLGAESLNEIDFAVECRRRNLPEPTRQVVRPLSHGKGVLDVFWEDYGVVVEVNGAGHDALDVAMRDEVRITDLQAQGNAVIPLSVLTLRCDPDPLRLVGAPPASPRLGSISRLARCVCGSGGSCDPFRRRCWRVTQVQAAAGAVAAWSLSATSPVTPVLAARPPTTNT